MQPFWLVALCVEALDLGALLAGKALVRDRSVGADVVVARVDSHVVLRIAPLASHVPERAVTCSDPINLSGIWSVWQRPIRLFARLELL